MDIPRQEIEETKKLIEELNSIKKIHYRELYKEIDHTNFQTCTKVDFKSIEVECNPENVRKIWGTLLFELGRENNYEESEIIFAHKSRSGSEYIVTRDGYVYRLSDHWGAVATCEWTLDGKGELRMSVMTTGPWQIGVANLEKFKIFRRKQPRKEDIIINPKWVEMIKVIIPLTQTLYDIKYSPEFITLSGPDKQLIGATHGNFSRILKEIEEISL
jgi:hypothetical protein